MANDLYEALNVTRDAPPEEIRKAYRKMALQTHPDRLPPGATETEKARAEEQFRKVNNAYEVLSDEEKRRIYDRQGEWPPPEVQQDPYADRAHRHGHHSTPFDDPFFAHPFGASPGSRPQARSPFGFTDPFALFNSIFGDTRHPFDDPFFAGSGAFGSHPFGHSSPFGGSFGGNPALGMFPGMNMHPALGDPFQSQIANFQSSSQGGFSHGSNGNGHWVSQSRMTRTINGVTESVWKRTDSNGNEHITYSYPDGNERYLINGVDQTAAPGTHGERSLPPPPPYPGLDPQPVSNSYRAMEHVRNKPDVNQHGTGPYVSAKIKREHDREREYVPRGHERGRDHWGHKRDHRDERDRKDHWWNRW
ncbi:hypothetical protein M0805_001155 [Coniferiporia weirii]|nr:hypothetical protein M0805_001155 [Coniferiporia weirii]